MSPFHEKIATLPISLKPINPGTVVQRKVLALPRNDQNTGPQVLAKIGVRELREKPRTFDE